MLLLRSIVKAVSSHSISVDTVDVLLWHCCCCWNDFRWWQELWL